MDVKKKMRPESAVVRVRDVDRLRASEWMLWRTGGGAPPAPDGPPRLDVVDVEPQLRVIRVEVGLL